MIIRSSAQVPRVTVLKRFPVPRNFGVSPESRIALGRTWPAPAGANRVKAFEVYRYDPDAEGNPRVDTFEVDLDDCSPMLLDALIWIKNKIDSTPVLSRGNLRIVRNEHRWHELAGLHEIHFRLGHAGDDLSSGEYEDHIKDLVPDLTHAFAQYSLIEPWLRSKTTEPERERLQSREERSRLDAFTSAFFASAAPRPALATGGTASVSTALPCSFRQPVACRQSRRGNRRAAR